MREHHRLQRVSRIAATLMLMLLTGWTTIGASSSLAAGTGSVTARLYICPDTLSLVAVQHSSAAQFLLADCNPFQPGFSFPRLRTLPGGSPTAGSVFAPGVLLWNHLPFGKYDFGGGNAPSGFGGLIVTNGASIPVADQENAPVSIRASRPHIERRFYFFTPASADVGSMVLTLYHCPAATPLNTTACTLLDPPPIDVAGIFQPGWPEANLSGFVHGQASWYGIPYGEYTLGYGGLVDIGQMAAIPEIGCVSLSECQVNIGPTSAVAELELFVYPLPSGTGSADHDGDGLTNNQESLLGTNSLNPDTDGDGASDGAEFNAGANPLDPADHP